MRVRNKEASEEEDKKARQINILKTRRWRKLREDKKAKEEEVEEEEPEEEQKKDVVRKKSDIGRSGMGKTSEQLKESEDWRRTMVTH